LEGNGKFGRAALAISVVASVTLLAMVAFSLVLAFTGHGTLRVNYIVGTTILICCLFELMAAALGVVGLFESSTKKRAALTFNAILFSDWLNASHSAAATP
jgi:hypothetical protein